MVLPRNAGLEGVKGAVRSFAMRVAYCTQWRRHGCNLIDSSLKHLRIACLVNRPNVRRKAVLENWTMVRKLMKSRVSKMSDLGVSSEI
jgi:hypothetical protein